MRDSTWLMADLNFHCRLCNIPLVVDTTAAGWEVRCPECGATQIVPTETVAADVGAGPELDDQKQHQAIPEFAAREPGSESFRYAAFISYRHAEPDRQWAKWLHSALETYRVPANLAKERGLPGRVGKVFRDEDELPASADLSEEIERALQGSRFLIVICSPRTTRSEWVNEEVVRFRRMGRHNQILALLVEGEPWQSFPKALREIRRTVLDEGGVSKEVIEEVEPLAADVRPTRTERKSRVKRMAKLRLLACIMGCQFDDLWQRENARRKKRLFQITAIAGSIAIIVTMLAVELLKQRTIASQLGNEVVSQKTLSSTLESEVANQKKIASEMGSKASALDTEVSQLQRLYSKAYGEEMDQDRLHAVAEALADPPPPLITTPVTWEAVDEARSKLFADKRAEVIKGLKTYQWEAIPHELFQSLFLPDDPRQSGLPPERFRGRGSAPPASTFPRGYDPSNQPNSRPGNSMTSGEPPMIKVAPFRLPERFIVSGILASVRVIANETFVYLGKSLAARGNDRYQRRMPNERAIPLMPVACVIFSGREVGESMADYSVGDDISIAVKREAGEDFTDPGARTMLLSMIQTQMRNQMGMDRRAIPVMDSMAQSVAEWKVFRMDSGRQFGDDRHLYWCFRGEGIERTGVPLSWIQPNLGRSQRFADATMVLRSPGRVLRSPAQGNAIKGILSGKYHSTRQNDGHVYANLMVLDPIEGPIPISIDLGHEVLLGEMLDFKPGSTVEARVTLIGAKYDRSIRNAIFDSVPRFEIQALINSSRSGPVKLHIQDDPLLEWNTLTATGDWIRIQNRPETLILAHGPRSKSLKEVQDNNTVTPDFAIAFPSIARDKQVTWIGDFYKISTSKDGTHLQVWVKDSAFGIGSFEAISNDSTLMKGLSDFAVAIDAAKKAGNLKASNVSVSGVIRSDDGVGSRLAPGSPLLELREFQRVGDPASRIVSGKKRE